MTSAAETKTAQEDPAEPAADPSENPQAPLSVEGIEYEVGGQPILRGVSLDVQPREILCLLGPSGCGKTSLLRIAAGIVRQTAGTVHVGGETVADDRHFVPPENRDLGLVFQDLALFPHLRILDNVVYGMKRPSRSKGEAIAALGSVGLTGTERAFPHQLSGGQQQRVALMRALLPAPAVVLFDEPFSGLDRNLRGVVRQDVAATLKAREATAVVVTHDPEEALSIADRIALMRDGQIVQVATPEEIWRWPCDLDAARMFSHVNVFEGRAKEGILDTDVGRVPVSAEHEGKSLVAAFRPEALTVFPADRGAGAALSVTRRQFYGAYVEITGRIGEAEVIVRADPYAAPHEDVVRIVPDLRQAIILPA